jgi:sugar phosphate permease
MAPPIPTASLLSGSAHGPSSVSSHSGEHNPGLKSKSYESALLRKVDFHLLPPLAFVYAFALIDRSNLGIARVVGMDADLELSIGDRFSILSMLFFIPYTLLQIPSNLIVRRVGPRLWISFCVLGWGIAQLSMGFSKSWGHLAVCRVFLGVFEAGYFPAMTFVITTW